MKARFVERLPLTAAPPAAVSPIVVGRNGMRWREAHQDFSRAD